MFTKLTLKNFKAWRDRIDVELTPVTMLLGTNSSGKSSLLQALLLLKQTAASPDRRIHLNLGGDEVDDYFNFGHFNDVLTHGASPRQFEIGFQFRRPPGIQPRVDSGEFTAIYGMTSSRAAVIQELILCTGPHKFRAVRRDKGAYSLSIDDESQPRGKSRAYAPERSIALPVEAIQLLAMEGPLAEDI